MQFSSIIIAIKEATMARARGALSEKLGSLKYTNYIYIHLYVPPALIGVEFGKKSLTILFHENKINIYVN